MDPSGLRLLLGVVTNEVHIRLGWLCQVFHFFFLGVSIDALDRIVFMVGYITTTIIIALVFCARDIFRHCFLLFDGCVGVGFNFYFSRLGFAGRNIYVCVAV